MSQRTIGQLYSIDVDAFHEATSSGIGIPRRRPDVRAQLENGACLASFDAGIHRIVDVDSPVMCRVTLIEFEHPGATPGLRL